MSNVRKTVLVVDNSSFAIKTVTNLVGESYKVVGMTSATAAFAYFEKEKPDVVLLDIDMPECNGFEFMSKFNSLPELAGIPVIFLTSNGSKQSMDKAYELGAIEYITKPVTKSILSACLTEHISKG